MTFNFPAKYKGIILYGISLALILILLKWIEWQFIIVDNLFEIYAGIIAVIFTSLGIWLATRLSKPKTVVIEKQVIVRDTEFILNEAMMNELGISRRELEVLQLMASGLSNQQIADRLFVSLNTVKTHSSNLFGKLDVKRRTQAIEKAKRLKLLP
ncbi:LuxR C-terminal-related transcriptional regulator [Mucilaginibacter sp. RS28]|uniref:LuxR C-terminal-related transcriptional regulator n=1 Tax=Mucilaginibacter straminoryzae TaxID=2932774 RepID=A0A9X1X4C0_9SPHI|nr:LuxR C-terminal-related transcriptional regulator [Mucilaginibacter straminoryzae]MCJ8208309.1 LuxR C-terminal-related transcriptional regulator [Mucilaginibacter straminoryzae]